jgi:hypothetical protein
MSTMRLRSLWYFLAAALFLAVCGCRGSGLVQATGKLTYQGKPVPSTRVTFQPDDGSRRSTGVTEDDGQFKLRFSRTQDGVKLGPHKVYLTYEVSAEEEIGKIKPKASRELKEVIARYGNAKAPLLQAEIKHDGQVIELELK